MSVYEELQAAQGDWDLQRDIIINYPYAQTPPKVKTGWGDVEPPPPDTFRDVYRAACAGIITMDQYLEMSDRRYHEAISLRKGEAQGHPFGGTSTSRASQAPRSLPGLPLPSAPKP